MQRVDEVIHADVRHDPDGEQLVGFTWRGKHYDVARLLGVRTPGLRSSLMYYRVATPDRQVFELHTDENSGVWTLDLVEDTAA